MIGKGDGSRMGISTSEREGTIVSNHWLSNNLPSAFLFFRFLGCVFFFAGFVSSFSFGAAAFLFRKATVVELGSFSYRNGLFSLACLSSRSSPEISPSVLVTRVGRGSGFRAARVRRLVGSSGTANGLSTNTEWRSVSRKELTGRFHCLQLNREDGMQSVPWCWPYLLAV